jgi:hypothetical protein
MRLTADRGVWHRPDEHHIVDGAVPTPRCFSACTPVDPDSIYFFGGCTADDKFFDAFYLLRVGESSVPSPQRLAGGAGMAATATSGNMTAAAANANAPATSSVAADAGQQGLPSSSAPLAQPSNVAAASSTRRSESVETYSWFRVRSRFGSPPTPRSGHTLSHVAGHLIVIGGNNSISMEVTSHAFNLMAAGWSQIRPAGEALYPRSGHTVTVINEQLYLIGGKQIFPTMVTYNDVLVGSFDPEDCSISWRRAAVNVEVDQRAYHSAVGYNTDIYVFGGIVNNVYCRELCRFDTANGIWTSINTTNTPGYSPPPPRSGHIAVLYGTEMVVFGSYSEESANMSLLALDLETLHWRTVDTRGPGPLRRAAPSGAVIPADSFRGKAARLLVFGGFDIAARRCFNEIHIITI